MDRRQKQISSRTGSNVDDGGAYRNRPDRMGIPDAGKRPGYVAGIFESSVGS